MVIDDHSQDKSRELVEKYIAINLSINFRLYETQNENENGNWKTNKCTMC